MWIAKGPLPASTGLIDRLGAHVLDHMALRAVVTGDRAAPLAFLRLVIQRLPEFCAPVAAADASPTAAALPTEATTATEAGR